MPIARTTIQAKSKVWIGSATALFCIVGAIIYFVVPNNRTNDLIQPASTQNDLTASILDDERTNPSAIISTAPTQYPDRKLRRAWHTTPDAAADEIERPENLPDSSVHVTLPGDYGQWLLGTPVELEIPQTNKKFRSVVDRIVPDEFGSTKIFTKPTADEKDFLRLVVTFNDTHTIAYVSTTLGSYELTAVERGGWLIPTNSLNKSRDFSLKDTGESLRFRHTNTKHVPPRDE